MSGRGLDLSQRQIRALCAGAKKEGFVPILRIGKVEIRLIPEEHAIPDDATPQVDRYKDVAL